MKLYYKGKFDAAHRLHDIFLTPEENQQAFGQCGQLHGHSWIVIFEVEGDNCQNGMLINFTELKALINTFDHKYINEVVDFLPTAENLAHYFLERLIEKNIFNSIKVQIWESDHAYAEDSWRSE